MFGDQYYTINATISCAATAGTLEIITFTSGSIFVAGLSEAEQQHLEMLEQLAKAKEEQERRDKMWRLARLPDPPPKAPRMKAPPPLPAWPTQIQRFRCTTKPRSAGR